MFGTPPSKPLTPHQVKQGAIARFVKPESLKEKGAWPREMKVLNDLMTRYPDLDFWTRHEPDFLLNSLAWFKSADGAAHLDRVYAVFHYDPTPNIVDEPTESDYNMDNIHDSVVVPPAPVVAQRPRTIAQFIKNKTTHGQS